MKRLNVVFLILILLVSTTSCNEEPIPSQELEFTSVAIPDTYRTDSSDGRIDTSDENVDEVTFQVIVTTEDGTESTGYGRIVFTDDESMSSFELTDNIFQETDLDANFWVDGMNDSSQGRVEAIQGCNCKEDYAKGDGRGKCRLACWGGYVGAAVVLVVVTISNL